MHQEFHIEVIRKEIRENRIPLTVIRKDADIGSTFYCIDPVKKADPEKSASSENEKATHRRIQKYRILLVEDNLINQKIIFHVLKNANHEVTIANNGIEAIKHLQANTDVDLIIMDIQMPEMNGYETTEMIRNSKNSWLNPAIPIIALTAYATANVRQKCLALGMNDFLAKPVDARRLFEVMERIMRNRN